MKKILFSSLMLAFLVGVTPAAVSADGGMMPISDNQPTTTAAPTTISADQYTVLVNKIIVSVLEIFDWKNDDGEISFTDTNYSVQYDCNTIFGTYSVNLTQVDLGTPASTLMACDEDAMAADDQLTEDLTNIDELTFKNGQLVMTGEDTELTFTASLAAEPVNYIGLNVDEAEDLAEENDTAFRVVEIDGEPQATTKDFRLGRINAVVESDEVIAYTIESEDTQVKYQALIGMTVDEAEDYAEALDVEFRIGTIDGEDRPVTLDYIEGRITAEIADDVVVGFTVE